MKTSQDTQIKWSATAEELRLIRKIADRAFALGLKMGLKQSNMDVMGLVMDLEATHCNGCPLKLAELLECPDFDFTHDVFGIHRHLDRKTGNLRDCFVPRTAADNFPMQCTALKA